MDERFIAPLVGVVLVLLGGRMLRSHITAWRQQRDDPALGDQERNFYRARYRRRMQTSAMIVFLGILIPVGDYLITLKKAPGWLALFWVIVLLMTGWVIILGMADWLSTAAHTRAALARLRRQQRELEQKLADFKKSRSNGRDEQDP
jgi:hypothetical protein